LKHIVIAGHSGGGQYTLRYAMASQVDDTEGVAVSYVVSNPDALVYLDELRPTPAAYPPAAAGPRFLPPASDDAFAPFVDARNCTTFNDWQFGLRNRTGYTAALTDEQLKQQLAARRWPICSAAPTSCRLAASTIHVRRWRKGQRDWLAAWRIPNT
jgi:hypothetical protein